jgi:hypothetical protein
MAETERDGLRNELNDALTALEESKRKMNAVTQVPNHCFPIAILSDGKIFC